MLIPKCPSPRPFIPVNIAVSVAGAPVTALVGIIHFALIEPRLVPWPFTWSFKRY